MDATGPLTAYTRAWSQVEESEAIVWLERCWTAQSTYLNPITDLVTGIAGLARLIVDYHDMFPEVRLQVDGEPRSHHEYVCLPWRLSSSRPIRVLGQDYGKAMSGIDVLRIDDSGKILFVVAFFGGRSAPGGADAVDLTASEWLLSPSGPHLARLLR